MSIEFDKYNANQLNIFLTFKELIKNSLKELANVKLENPVGDNTEKTKIMLGNVIRESIENILLIKIGTPTTTISEELNQLMNKMNELKKIEKQVKLEPNNEIRKKELETQRANFSSLTNLIKDPKLKELAEGIGLGNSNPTEETRNKMDSTNTQPIKKQYNTEEERKPLTLKNKIEGDDANNNSIDEEEEDSIDEEEEEEDSSGEEDDEEERGDDSITPTPNPNANPNATPNANPNLEPKGPEPKGLEPNADDVAFQKWKDLFNKLLNGLSQGPGSSPGSSPGTVLEDDVPNSQPESDAANSNPADKLKPTPSSNPNASADDRLKQAIKDALKNPVTKTDNNFIANIGITKNEIQKYFDEIWKLGITNRRITDDENIKKTALKAFNESIITNRIFAVLLNRLLLTNTDQYNPDSDKYLIHKSIRELTDEPHERLKLYKLFYPTEITFPESVKEDDQPDRTKPTRDEVDRYTDTILKSKISDYEKLLRDLFNKYKDKLKKLGGLLDALDKARNSRNIKQIRDALGDLLQYDFEEEDPGVEEEDVEFNKLKDKIRRTPHGLGNSYYESCLRNLIDRYKDSTDKLKGLNELIAALDKAREALNKAREALNEANKESYLNALRNERKALGELFKFPSPSDTDMDTDTDTDMDKLIRNLLETIQKYPFDLPGFGFPSVPDMSMPEWYMNEFLKKHANLQNLKELLERIAKLRRENNMRDLLAALAELDNYDPANDDGTDGQTGKDELDKLKDLLKPKPGNTNPIVKPEPPKPGETPDNGLVDELVKQIIGNKKVEMSLYELIYAAIDPIETKNMFDDDDDKYVKYIDDIFDKLTLEKIKEEYDDNVENQILEITKNFGNNNVDEYDFILSGLTTIFIELYKKNKEEQEDSIIFLQDVIGQLYVTVQNQKVKT